jgi:flotillin
VFDFIGIQGGAALLVLAVVLVVVLLIAFAASRYRVANANEALIVAGSKGASLRDASGKALGVGDQGIRVVVGGGTIVWPLRNRVGRLELTARQIKVILPDAITCQGIKVHVEGVATFKIGRDVESIRNAAERFLGTNPAYIDDIVKNVLEGSLRSIVGTLTIEELIMDREKLLQRVQDNAKLDLSTTGIEIDSFTIQSIEDESGYITQLGLQKLAPVTRDAKIAQALADQESSVKQAEAEQIKINAARDVALRQAEAQQVTAAAKATADQAGPLAQAQAQQEVVRRQTELAMLEAERREKELLAATIKPAEADAQAAVRRAEGDKAARIALAEAEARHVQLAGEAEACIVLTKGRAEAEALALKAEAYQQFNQAAVLQTILENLPEIVRAAAEPMSNIGQLTVLSTDGATDLVKTTTETVAQATETIKGLTGIDLAAVVAAAVAGDGVKQPKPRRLAETLWEEAPADGKGDGSTVVGSRMATLVEDAPEPVEGPAAPAESTPAESAPPGPAPAAPVAPAPKVENVTPAAAVAPSAAAQPAGKTAVDAALREVATQLKRVPGTGVPRVRAIAIGDLANRGPKAVRDLWGRYSSRIPESYQGLTIGELIDRYGG